MKVSGDKNAPLFDLSRLADKETPRHAADDPEGKQVDEREDDEEEIGTRV
jgi:hypothetical protein